MPSYELTKKDAVRGAITDIEETLQKRPFTALTKGEQREIQEDIQVILTTLGDASPINDFPTLEIARALETIKTLLDLADHDGRQLLPEECETVRGAALALQVACQPAA